MREKVTSRAREPREESVTSAEITQMQTRSLGSNLSGKTTMMQPVKVQKVLKEAEQVEAG